MPMCGCFGIWHLLRMSGTRVDLIASRTIPAAFPAVPIGLQFMPRSSSAPAQRCRLDLRDIQILQCIYRGKLLVLDKPQALHAVRYQCPWLVRRKSFLRNMTWSSCTYRRPIPSLGRKESGSIAWAVVLFFSDQKSSPVLSSIIFH